jgi:hypothetical protein
LVSVLCIALGVGTVIAPAKNGIAQQLVYLNVGLRVAGECWNGILLAETRFVCLSKGIPINGLTTNEKEFAIAACAVDLFLVKQASAIFFGLLGPENIEEFNSSLGIGSIIRVEWGNLIDRTEAAVRSQHQPNRSCISGILPFNNKPPASVIEAVFNPNVFSEDKGAFDRLSYSNLGTRDIGLSIHNTNLAGYNEILHGAENDQPYPHQHSSDDFEAI